MMIVLFAVHKQIPITITASGLDWEVVHEVVWVPCDLPLYVYEVRQLQITAMLRGVRL